MRNKFLWLFMLLVALVPLGASTFEPINNTMQVSARKYGVANTEILLEILSSSGSYLQGTSKIVSLTNEMTSYALPVFKWSLSGNYYGNTAARAFSTGIIKLSFTFTPLKTESGAYLNYTVTPSFEKPRIGQSFVPVTLNERNYTGSYSSNATALAISASNQTMVITYTMNVSAGDSQPLHWIQGGEFDLKITSFNINSTPGGYYVANVYANIVTP